MTCPSTGEYLWDDEPTEVTPSLAAEVFARAGEVIDSRYEIEAQIGSGAMGKVYRVRHVTVGRTFALKLLRKTLKDNLNVRARFIREAQATGKMRHRNIVEISDAGVTAEGLPFLVMELLDGEPLGSILGREGALPMVGALTIGEQLLGGLAHAHAAGVVHRDVKPNNAIILRDGTLKLVDFGLARLLSDEATAITKTGEMLGTPSYFSPEQAEGKPVDERSDAWGATVCLYEMATGTLPFGGRRLVQVLRGVLTGTPTAPSEHREDLPDGFDAMIERGLRKDPDERASVPELLEQVRAMRRALDRVHATPG